MTNLSNVFSFKKVMFFERQSNIFTLLRGTLVNVALGENNLEEKNYIAKINMQIYTLFFLLLNSFLIDLFCSFEMSKRCADYVTAPN